MLQTDFEISVIYFKCYLSVYNFCNVD